MTNSRLSKMLELNDILDIVDKRFISLYKNEDFDQIISSTTKKIKRGKKSANHFVSRGLAYHAKGKFASAHDDFLEAKQLGLKNAIIEPLVRKNQLNATFISYFEKFKVDNDSIDNLFNLGEVLEHLDPSSIELINKTDYEQLSSLYMKLMDTNGSVTPRSLGRIAYNHIKTDPVINEIQNYVSKL